MTRERPDTRNSLPSFIYFAAVVACLYLGREFLLPVILAALLCFLLAPLLTILEGWKVGRILSVLIVTMLAFVVIGALTYVMISQLLDFAKDLPSYRSNLLGKVTALREQSGGPLGSAMATVQEVLSALNPVPKEGTAPVPVVVQGSQGTTGVLAGIVMPILGPLGNMAVVSVLVIFMLLGREDLRDRLIHLVGRGHMGVTTEALDEASTRVSGYLRAQLLINVLYGIPVAVGLYFIGIPNAALWGVLAVLLRFLPYIGPWIAAAFPIALSLAVSQNWNQLLLTCGLFVAMELLSNNVIEPWLYGASTGLSPFAIIISALFWAWIWGGVGLVLATPLTVCLAVAGKHVPGLTFLDVLLGEKPPIDHSERLYQRLLALDEEECLEMVQASAKEHGLAQAADKVLLPALMTLEAESRTGILPEKSQTAALTLLRQICVEMADPPTTPLRGQKVLCLPAMDEGDEITALLLCEALTSRGVLATVPSSNLLLSESIELAVSSEAAVICIVNFPPSSVLVAGNVCQRLKERLPNAYITALLWQPDDQEFARRRDRLKHRGSYDVFPSIERAVPTLSQLSECEPTTAADDGKTKTDSAVPIESPESSEISG